MDRRQRKSRKAIFQAFEELMAEQHYASVTVGQIIERADIGRSTFYAHFSTKDDLLNQMCVELFAPLFEEMDAVTPAYADATDPELEAPLAHLLERLRDTHQGICGKLLAEREPHFTAHFCKRLSTFFTPRLPERSSWVPQDLMIDLLVNGFCQAISWWYGQSYQASPEQLAHWYARTMGWPVKSR